jgi:hypothetical protein
MDKNTEEYCWADIKVRMFGNEVTGIRAVKYGSKWDKTPGYAQGNSPRFMERKNKSYNCEIKLLQSELEAIIVSGGGDPTVIPPFDIVIAYVPTQGLPVVIDIVKNAEFDNFDKDSKQGDGAMEITMGIQCLSINYNTVG